MKPDRAKLLSKIAVPETRELIGKEALVSHPVDRLALFLDIDGTLVDFAETPDAVSVDPTVRVLLGRLARCFDGAVALVTGRAVADVEKLFPQLTLPVAGQHGAEFRGITPGATEVPAEEPLRRLRAAAGAARRAHPRLLFEDKGRSLAIHYRRAPALAPIARWLALRLAGTAGGQWVVQRGLYVEEIKSAAANKGEAIRRLLDEPAFRGRLPIFIGDDVSDEDGFRAVNLLGGVSIKVGSGPTLAQWRLRGPAAVIAWLEQLTQLCRSGQEEAE